jgi:nucleotide-binding universal stress UspA family protein
MNILLCIDFSESTDKILEKTEELEKLTTAKLWILYVAEPEPDFVGFDVGPQSVRDSQSEQFHSEHRQVQELAERFGKSGVDATALMIQGPTAETILKEAAKLKADIIIIGSHGKGLAYKLLVGSVSEQVIQKAECPVFVVPTHQR